MLAGSEINEHPYAPITAWGRRLLAEQGDDAPVGWLHRSQRYGEKLATPDTSVGDLVGDVDPIKVAEGRTLGDPETVHYGLVPRTNRGIFAINELPDLAERIQVSLLNVLEERDIQVRGYQLRLPLDLLLVASANPEDYTNRGRIITPLKDRFGAEIRTHYPLRLDDEIALVRQEADARRPRARNHLVEVLARFTRMVRESPAVDQRSGVSARFPVAGAETVAAQRAASRRDHRRGGGGRPGRRPARHRADAARQGRVRGVARRAARSRCSGTCCAARSPRRSGSGWPAPTCPALVARFEEGDTVETGELVPAEELLRRVGPVEGLGRLVSRLGEDDAESPGVAAAGLEFALEGLYLIRRISKDEIGGRTVYGGG